ncbi:hypothetical protein BT69DRAFT_1281611 [Atractiella rhizophila]|nr:hypothetical protein BT69DRAFT_1281611 [Atractiella rhizophila]
MLLRMLGLFSAIFLIEESLKRQAAFIQESCKSSKTLTVTFGSLAPRPSCSGSTHDGPSCPQRTKGLTSQTIASTMLTNMNRRESW